MAFALAGETDGALGGDKKTALPERRRVAEHLVEEFLARAGAIDVRMVKQGVASLERGQHRRLRAGVVRLATFFWLLLRLA